MVKMASWIEDEKSILDLGCGPMWLKEYLKKSSTYYGCDYKNRGNKTIICDFNKKEFPDIKTDLCFVSGCLEYIEDLDWFIKRISETSKTAIISYCPLDNNPFKFMRKKAAWVNHYSSYDIIKLFIEEGFKLHKIDTVTKNIIFKFVK